MILEQANCMSDLVEKMNKKDGSRKTLEKLQTTSKNNECEFVLGKLLFKLTLEASVTVLSLPIPLLSDFRTAFSGVV